MEKIINWVLIIIKGIKIVIGKLKNNVVYIGKNKHTNIKDNHFENTSIVIKGNEGCEINNNTFTRK